MVSREYRGPPIDLRYQYITERPNMTAAPPEDEDDEDEYWGTSPDDFFSESTDSLPSYLDEESIPEDELEAIKRALFVSISHAASTWEKYSETDIKRIVDKHLKKEHIQKIRDYELVPSMPLDELPDSQRAAAEAYLLHPDFPEITPRELARENEFHANTARRAIHAAFPEQRGFEDLPDQYQLAIKIWAYEGTDKKPADIKKKYDKPNDRAIGDARRIYPDLIEEQAPVSEEKLEEAIKNYKKNRNTSSKSSQTATAKRPAEEKQYGGLTSNQKAIVDEIAKTPGVVGTAIAERLGLEYPTSVYGVVKKYPHIVKQRIEEEGAVDSVDDIDDNILEKAAGLGEWDLSKGTEERESDPMPEREIEFELEREYEPEPEPPRMVEQPIPEIERAEVPFLREQEKVIFLRGELAQVAREYVERSGEYSSIEDLAKAAVKKELDGEYDEPDDDPSGNVHVDAVEAIIELADGDSEKADAIRTLISNE